MYLWNSLNSGADAYSGSRSAWPADAYAAYRDRVTSINPDYPCHFALTGHRDGNNWFTAVEPEASPGDAAGDLAAALRSFRQRAWTGPKRQTLLVFVGPPDAAPDLDRDYQRFWDLLAALTVADDQPWPDSRPRDCADPKWEWCFDGEPWFVFGCSPAYRSRRSRTLGPCLTLVFQVRRVFEGLSGTSPAGQAAKKRVRGRLPGYDAVPVHPHLGDDEHSSVFKWRQYMLPDDQQVRDRWPASGPGHGRHRHGRHGHGGHRRWRARRWRQRRWHRAPEAPAPEPRAPEARAGR
jgi:hypothetical protein